MKDLAYAEVEEVLRDGEPVTIDKLNQMKYLERCIKEALRLYPSVPMIGRVVYEDMILRMYFGLLLLFVGVNVPFKEFYLKIVGFQGKILPIVFRDLKYCKIYLIRLRTLYINVFIVQTSQFFSIICL